MLTAQTYVNTVATLRRVWTVSPSVRWVSWFNAWTAGSVSLDDARDAVVADDTAHDVLDAGGDATPLIVAWGRLRRQGAQEATVALVEPGDPYGLAGPPDFNEAALDAGEAVLLSGADTGLVPHVVGRGVFWREHPAHQAPMVADVAEAESELRSVLARAAERLSDLDVARWRPELADALLGLRDRTDPVLAPGVDVRAERLAALALRCLRIGGLAASSSSGAVSAYESDVGHGSLSALTRAARHALVAATNAPVRR